MDGFWCARGLTRFDNVISQQFACSIGRRPFADEIDTVYLDRGMRRMMRSSDACVQRYMEIQCFENSLTGGTDRYLVSRTCLIVDPSDLNRVKMCVTLTVVSKCIPTNE